jgi:hypothetical protein
MIEKGDIRTLFSSPMQASSASLPTSKMGKLDTVSSKSHSDFPQPREDEESLTLRTDWSVEEERRAKRKYVTPCFPVALLLEA